MTGGEPNVFALIQFAESIPGVYVTSYAPGHFAHQCKSCRSWMNNQDCNDHSGVQHFPNCLYVAARAALGEDVTGFKVRKA